MDESLANATLVGRGRGGLVYRTRRERGDDDGADHGSVEAARADADHADIAHKLFLPDPAARRWVSFLTGAPVPYGWSADAIAAAVARRRVAEVLVRYWFGDRLRVPETFGFEFNEAAGAYELQYEYVDAPHAPLRRPDAPDDGALTELRHRIMRPLHRRLAEAGLDGLAWSAGLGNPAGVGNFLLEADDQPADDDRPPLHRPSAYRASPTPCLARRRWVWVDLESAAPAVVPLHPARWLTYYLPRCVRHGRLLFDDVDLDKLRFYVACHREPITRECGREAYMELNRAVHELERHQRDFRALGPARAGVEYHRVTGRLTERQAAWWRLRPICWRGRRIASGLNIAWRALRTFHYRTIDRLATLRWAHVFDRIGRFVGSRRYRAAIGRRAMIASIDAWADRRSIDEEHAMRLQRAMRCPDARETVTDFAAHQAVLPALRWVQGIAATALAMTGQFGLAAATVLFGGAAMRTGYSTVRLAKLALAGQRPPGTALLVGMLPLVGRLAYPIQLLRRADGELLELARFTLYDACARFGAAIPLWGGRDSVTEHLCCRLPDRLLGRLMRLPIDAKTTGAASASAAALARRRQAA